MTETHDLTAFNAARNKSLTNDRLDRAALAILGRVENMNITPKCAVRFIGDKQLEVEVASRAFEVESALYNRRLTIARAKVASELAAAKVLDRDTEIARLRELYDDKLEASTIRLKNRGGYYDFSHEVNIADKNIAMLIELLQAAIFKYRTA